MPAAGPAKRGNNNGQTADLKGTVMEKCCKDCRHFSDAHYSRTYVSPICTAHGGDDASFFRQYICGLDNPKLFSPKPSLPTHEESVRPD